MLLFAPVTMASHGNGLIHRYKFDEKSGTTALDHHKKNPVNGVLSATVSRVNGLVGRGAIELTGQDSSSVTFSGNVGQFGTSDFTVAFWVKTTDTLRIFDLVGNRDAGSHGNFFQVRMTGSHENGNGRIVAEIDQDGAGTNHIPLQSGTGFNDGQPHHVAVTRNGNTMKLYIDGGLDDSSSSSGAANVANGNPFKIGRSLAPSVAPLFTPVATIDDLRIYNRGLTSEQIEDLADVDNGNDDD